jgi:hypothetical protein
MCTGTHPFIPAPGVALLEIFMLQDNQRMENTLHFLAGSAWTGGQLADLNAAARASWATFIAPITSPSVQVVRFKATDMENEFGAYDELDPGTLVGTRAGTPLMNGVSLRLRFTTAKRGKSYRGGPFLTGLMIDDIEGTTHNEIKAAVATAFRDAWSNFKSDLEVATSSRLVVTSYCADNIWRTEAVSTTVTGITFADNTYDRQWRRAPGRGA